MYMFESNAGCQFLHTIDDRLRSNFKPAIQEELSLKSFAIVRDNFVDWLAQFNASLRGFSVVLLI